MENMWATNEGESRILRATAEGQVADLSDLNEPDRIIRPSFFRALIQGRLPGHSVDDFGIHIQGAVFTEGLNLDNLDFRNPLVLYACAFIKEVSLKNARLIRMSLSDSYFRSALDVTGLVTSGDFRVTDTRFDSGLFLSSAHIGGNCLLSVIAVKPEGDTAVAINGVRIDGNLVLRDVDLQGQLFMLGAQIGGSLRLDGKYQSEENHAILADNSAISGSVIFGRKSCALGSVSMIGVSIGLDLTLIGSTFTGCDSRLLLSRCRVSGDVKMTECRLESHLFVNSAFFGGNWIAASNEQDSAFMGNINARGITVMGDAYLGHLCPENLSHREWDFTGGKFNGQLTIPSQKSPFQLLLGRSSCVTLDVAIPEKEDARAWVLQGIQFGALKDPTEAANASMLTLIRQADGGQYLPQPYRQLFRALREAGHAELAVNVAVAMSRHRYHQLYEQTVGWRRMRILILDRLSRITDYGYSTHRLYQAAFWIWVTGAFIYSLVALEGMHYMVPTMDAVFSSGSPAGGWYVVGYPGFSGPVYALDQFLPIIDFGQATMWHPRVDPVNGSFNVIGWILTGVNWFLVGAGWILSTLLVTAASGLMRRVDPDQ